MQILKWLSQQDAGHTVVTMSFRNLRQRRHIQTANENETTYVVTAT